MSYCWTCGKEMDGVYCQNPTCPARGSLQEAADFLCVRCGLPLAGSLTPGHTVDREGRHGRLIDGKPFCSRCASERGGPQPSGGAVAPSPPRRELAPPSAEIEGVWIKFDLVRDGRKGMEFHIRFHISNHRGRRGRACIFVYEEDGDPVRNDGEGCYVTPSGFLTVQETFTPRYDQSLYEDFCLFLPYDQFYRGSCSYYAIAAIQDGDGRSLDRKPTGGFEVRRRS